MAEYNKPLPVIETWNAPYWQAAKRHEFVAQKCRACGYIHLPPGPVCTNCLSNDQEWVPLWFLQYVLYHEMLHAFVPEEALPGGRRRVHTDEFYRRERKFRGYHRARRWEADNLARFLLAAADSKCETQRP